MPSRYNYKTLPQVADDPLPYIRLLRIYGTGSGGTLKGKLEVRHLKRVESQYSALSYTWADRNGDQLQTSSIIIDGAKVTITPNLERALRVIHQRYPNTFLWADALCINQNDLVEKASQVIKMNVIYGYAQRTLVWLGDFDRRFQPSTCELFDRLLHCPDPRITMKEWREKFFPGLWTEVPWFQRTWVVQEVGCNNTDDVRLLFGEDRELPWENLLARLPPLPDFDWQDNEPWTDANKIEGLLHIRDEHTKRGSILFLMERFASFKCSQPRDRIAAMAGMQNPPRRKMATEIYINYTSSDQEMFSCFSVHLVDRGYGLALLWLAVIKGPKLYPWPSWVPDWSKDSSRKPALDIDDFLGYYAKYSDSESRLEIRCYSLETYSNGCLAVFQKPKPEGHSITIVLEAKRMPNYYTLRSRQAHDRLGRGPLGPKEFGKLLFLQ